MYYIATTLTDSPKQDISEEAMLLKLNSEFLSPKLITYAEALTN